MRQMARIRSRDVLHSSDNMMQTIMANELRRMVSPKTELTLTIVATALCVYLSCSDNAVRTSSHIIVSGSGVASRIDEVKKGLIIRSE